MPADEHGSARGCGQLRAGLGVAPLGLPDWPQTLDGTPLVARCLMLDDGQLRLAIVSLTVLALCPEAVRQVRETVGKAAGIPAAHVMCACTHVHTGPPTLSDDPTVRAGFAPYLCAAAAAAARQAAAAQPVRLGWATDRLRGVSRVRRILRRDGSVITLRRAWPQYWGWATDPETVRPEEALDDVLTVVRIEDAGGQALGAILHFTCHPLPDFVGYAAALVERCTPGAVCLMLNGCLGSVDTPFEVPMRGRTQAEQLPILGDILGYRALELLARAETSEHHPLGVSSREVFLPLDPRFLANPGLRLGLWPEAIRDGGFRTETQCLRIGELALAGIPGEAHVGLGAQLEQASGFSHTRPVGLANGECGYLFPEAARARGGYEADPAMWGVVSGKGVGALLEGLGACLAELRAGAN